MEAGGASLPLSDARADQSRAAKGGRWSWPTRPLDKSAPSSDDATRVSNASFCSLLGNVSVKAKDLNETDDEWTEAPLIHVCRRIKCQKV